MRRLSGYQSSSARREGRRRTRHIEEQGAVSVGALVDNGGDNRQRAKGRDDRSQSRSDERAARRRLAARSTGRWYGSNDAETGRSNLVLDDDRRQSSERGDDDRGCRGDHGDVNERRGQRRDQRWLSDRSDPDRWGPGDDADDEYDHGTSGVGARLRPQWQCQHLLLLAEENVMEVFEVRDGGRQRGVGVVADGREDAAVADVLHRHSTMKEVVIDDIAFTWVLSTVSDRSRHSGLTSRIAPRTTGGVKLIVWHT